MKKIEWHSFDKVFVKDRVEWNMEIFENYHEYSFDGIYDTMKTLSIGIYALEKDEKKTTLYLRYAMKALLAHFEQASYPGQEVEVEICGEKLKVMGEESENYKLGPMFWLEGIYMAIVLRNKESIVKFMNVPVQVMLDAQMADEELFMVFVFFLRSYLSADKDTGKLLIDTYKLSDPGLYTPERNLYIQNTVTPQLELFISILKDDQTDFDKYLEKALSKFKSFYSEMPKEEYGLVSFPFVAICILARERGLKIEIESDYIPKFMIEGNF